MIFFDTEGVGSTGPLVTVQLVTMSAEERKLLEVPKCWIAFHQIWEHPLQITQKLIETLATHEEGICGFNLVHDWFQLSKWYNIFRQLTQEELNECPTQTIIGRVKCIEAAGPTVNDVCLKPRKACDLLLLAKAGKYQYLAKHKSIVLRKLPAALFQQGEYQVYRTLSERISLPPGLGIRWRISKKLQGRRDVVDVLGDFYPSSAFEGESNDLRPGEATKKHTFASLKQLISIIRKDPSIARQTFESEVGHVPYRDAPEYQPWGGEWERGLDYLRVKFQDDKRAIDYAIRDVDYTYSLWRDLNFPQPGDDDSELACLVGASYWKGFAIAPKEVLLNKIIEYNEKVKEIENDCNPNSPGSVLEYLHSLCSDMDRLALPDTKRTTLEVVERSEDWIGHPVQDAIRRVQGARKASKRKKMLSNLLKVGSFHFMMKVQGTLSSRMAGGAEREKIGFGKSEKLNPQGIPRESEFRSLFLMAYPEETLEGGDFSGFEVSIADAVYNDPVLRADHLGEAKIHAVVGSLFYDCSVEEILATKGSAGRDLYDNAKRAFFAYLYGGTAFSLRKHLNLEEKEILPGLQRLQQRYANVSAARKVLRELFIPLRQERGVGTEIEWVEPSEFIEALKLPWQTQGFRRYFTSEWAIIRGLYELAITPPEEWTKIPGECRRTNRSQSIVGATQSALYASIFALQEHVFRAAANHEIQSPGAQITKHLQRKIWDIQPPGISAWKVRPFNVHDEVLCPRAQFVQDAEDVLSENVVKFPAFVVHQVIQELQQTIPLLKIKWQANLKTWGDKE